MPGEKSRVRALSRDVPSHLIDVTGQTRENQFKEKDENHAREMSVTSQQCRADNVPVLAMSRLDRLLLLI